jgi:hypothetical protein
MATIAGNTVPDRSAATPASVWTGRVLSGLAAAFLLVDAGTKLVAPQFAIGNSPPLDWQFDVATMRTLGTLLLIPTLLYIWPRTAVLGAVLITGYLGGAIATHLRVDSPLLTHTLFGVYLGLMVWSGLWLRNPALRSVIPFASERN